MYEKYIKRLIDFIIALVGLPFFAVIFIIVAPIIYLEDKGPIFYVSNRLGYKTKTFKMFKFRSMKVNAPDLRNADGSTYNSETDSRLTKIGKILRKTSIDETPQLFNVLIGDMSFVGPRPGTTDSVLSDGEKKRRSVRPGITGYSQALKRNSDTMDERMKNDIYYAEHVSLFLDIKIIFMTVFSVLGGKSIYRN